MCWHVVHVRLCSHVAGKLYAKRAARAVERWRWWWSTGKQMLLHARAARLHARCSVWGRTAGRANRPGAGHHPTHLVHSSADVRTALSGNVCWAWDKPSRHPLSRLPGSLDSTAWICGLLCLRVPLRLRTALCTSMYRYVCRTQL